MALSGRDVVALSYSDWNASWSTPQQLMSRLVPGCRVLYVDQPRSFLYRLKPGDPMGAGAWSGPALQAVGERFWVYHPPLVFLPIGGLPLPVARWCMRFNGWLLGRLISRAMAQLGFQDAILWNFSPLHGTAVPHIPHALHLYDIADVWTNYLKRATDRALIDEVEVQLCRAADLVLPSTDAIAAMRQGLHPDMPVVPHGADFAHFAEAGAPGPIPPELAALPRPIIGSVGVIDPDRFDVELIEYLSQARPEWSIVLVGPPRADMDLSRLQQLPNVYLTGNKAIAELPHYLRGMDVTLVPYRVNDATRSIYPLKLQEYLSTGKPVVSSAMPSIVPFGAVVAIAGSHAEFVQRIEACLAEDSAERRAARQAVARENSWDHRVEEKSAHILRVMRSR